MKRDTELRQDVLDEIKWEPSVNANDIGVAVHDGVVTLTGCVPSYSEKLAAERAAGRVSGVKAIAEEIEVKLPSSSRRTDTDIAQAVAYALKWNPVVEKEIKVKVEDGVVTLSGDVNWHYERDSIKCSVENLTGVRKIVNLVRVHVPPSTADIKEQIKKAFERAASLDAAQIHVETHDGEVILKGNVHSMAELREAEYGALAGPGVTKVTNQLKVV